MTLQGFLPAFRFPAFALFSRLSAFIRPRPRRPLPPQDAEDRYAAWEEMLLTNPAAFASELGMQWMHTAYRRY
ncbi:hypothetical protein [Oricola sp.]|nr:hypothetical protein [Ahrensia sp.]|tara:strand:+ start:4720 stop:4938 length:219 start_codon:yes stop_codon:yes gene_type:complete